MSYSSRFDVFFGLGVAACSVFLLLWLIPSQVGPIGSSRALIPVCASVILFLMGAVMLLNALLRLRIQRSEKTIFQPVRLQGRRRPLVIVGIIALAAMAVPIVGLTIAVSLLLLASLIALGVRTKNSIALISIVIPALAYVILQYGFRVRLPTSPLLPI